MNRRPLDYESSALPLSYGGTPYGAGGIRTRDLLSAIQALSQTELRPLALRSSAGAGLTGLEPATSGVTDRHSNQLSYSPWGVRHGAYWTRTSDLYDVNVAL